MLRLIEGVERHRSGLDVWRFVVLTDYPPHPCFETIQVNAKLLPGWWSKMYLFDREGLGADYRNDRLIYIDLDTVICGPVEPLSLWDGDFGICQNFTRLRGHHTWPCNYGSCVMSLAPRWGQHIWEAFKRDHTQIMIDNPKGDQQAIEALAPGAIYLQDVMPKDYFLHYRDMVNHKPEGTSVVVFGGHHTPANNSMKWVGEEWRV